jgi:hypothetical protein
VLREGLEPPVVPVCRTGAVAAVPSEHCLEPIEGLAPPWGFLPPVYKTGAVAAEPNRHVLVVPVGDDPTSSA